MGRRGRADRGEVEHLVIRKYPRNVGYEGEISDQKMSGNKTSVMRWLKEFEAGRSGKRAKRGGRILLRVKKEFESALSKRSGKA